MDIGVYVGIVLRPLEKTPYVAVADMLLGVQVRECGIRIGMTHRAAFLGTIPPCSPLRDV